MGYLLAIRTRRTATIALSLLLATLPATSLAQSPDVAIFADLRPTFGREKTDRAVFRWYDRSGRMSLVGFRVILESGNRLYLAQRIQRIDIDSDPSSLDEAYLESRGNWRLGRQYLPFGQGLLLRESCLAIRFDTTLLVDNVPIKVAYADQGTNRTRGVSARAGRPSFGLSAAFGDHFGIQATSLTPFRSPEQGAGPGRGYKLVLGADAEIQSRDWIFQAEYARFTEPSNNSDPNLSLSDLRATYRFSDLDLRFTLAWARDWNKSANGFRLEGDYQLDAKTTLSPYLRIESGKVKDFGITSRFRL
ncbi:MAG: hypothetical protein MUC92_06190 [Fimbriimonadaceae bacterium]|nr:hypothetical protein [Fimbriimonadaceae bacterium]